jgi:hypothetical protein
VDITELTKYLTPEDLKIVASIVDGAKVGDAYCQILLHEYVEIQKDDKKLKVFLDIVNGETSEIACRKWYYIDKQIFIDNRNYL